ncbi:MAG: HAD-IA family hydrolase [Nitrospirae bacterium]|nr:HAD-IA family hydrolase [Nitrospirota bacterium]MBI3595367.1 HAD-IA family hydrolase [Nitrospirota bacterium]
MNLIAIDLDGTLEDSRRDMISSVHRVRAGFSLSRRSDDRIAPWVNQGMERLYLNCFDDYLEKGIYPERMNIVRNAYELDYLGQVATETRLYPGISEALSGLSLVGRLVVVTNKPEKISKRLLKELKIDHWISGLVGGDTIGKIKPDPALLQEAARLAGYSSDSGISFMIGDTSGDIQMGRAFGAVTIWCAWGYSKNPGVAPHETATDPEQLKELVQKRTPKQIEAII